MRRSPSRVAANPSSSSNRPVPWVPVSSVIIGCAAKTGTGTPRIATTASAKSAASRWIIARLQPVGALGETVGKLRRKLEGFVLLHPVLGHKHCKVPAVDPSRHVVPRGDRQERTRVVVEADGIVEAGRFRHLLAKAQHAFGTVVEPPRGTELQSRVVSR